MKKESNISKFWKFVTKPFAIIGFIIGLVVLFYSTNSIVEDYTSLHGMVIEGNNEVQIGASVIVEDLDAKTDQNGEFFLKNVRIKRYRSPFDKEFFLKKELMNMIKMDCLEGKTIAYLTIVLGNEILKDSIVYNPLTTYGLNGKYKGGEVQVFEVESKNH